MPYLDEISPEARAIGCVNTIVRRGQQLFGTNTDYAGFLYMAQRSGISFADKKVLILGNGGTSLTAQTAIRDAGARRIVVVSRRGEVRYDQLSDHRDAQIIVNTTPVGMIPNPGVKLVSLTDFPQLEGVLDVIYNPLSTALLLEARALGIPHGNGLAMLVAQAKGAADLFLGKSLPAERIDAVIQTMRSRIQNLVLVGMPGSGKTTIGKLLAERSGKQFVDLDELIEERAGMRISEYFKIHGESSFRELERQAAADTGKNKSLVIATGGGAVLRADNRDSLRQNGLVFFLQRELDQLPKENRPLSLASASLESMYAERLPAYLAASDFIIDNNRSPEQTVSEIIRRSES